MESLHGGPSRRSIFLSAMPDKAKRSLGNWKRGWQGSVFRRCIQSVISLMKWSITREKLPRRAILGSIGMDAVASGPSDWMTYIHFISEI